jgi:hypothetical protein
MKRGSIIFLQIVITLFGLGILAFLLIMPHFEGRNTNSTVFEVYFKDPFLAYVYVASIPFFLGVYQAIKVLGCVGHNKMFSPETVKALRIIKHCAIAIIGFVVVSAVFFTLSDPADDDGPQGVVMRLFVIFASTIVATTAAMFERILQNGVEIKSENDLTV